MSQVVKCERGYYIIKCINTLDREETDANKLKIVEERKREVFGQEYDSFVNTLVRQLNDKLWDEITLIMDEQVTTDNFLMCMQSTFRRSNFWFFTRFIKILELRKY